MPSGAQRLAVPVARLAETWRHREQSGADMLDVLNEQVALAEHPLDRYELDSRVLLERDEEQARVELPGLRVGAVGVGVSAAEDALTTVAGRRGEPNVCVGVDHQAPIRPLGRQVDEIELGPAGQRRAGVLA